MPDKTRSKKNRLATFFSYFKPHKKLFLLDMACALTIAGVDLVFPLITRYTYQTLLPNNLYSVFFAVVAGMVIAYGLRSLVQYVVNYWGHIFGVRVEADMRRDIFSHLQTLNFSFYDHTRTGHLMSRVTYDLFEITELAHHGPEDFLISIVTLTGSLIIMMTINWQLALALLVIVPILVIFVVLERRHMSRASRKVKERTAGINAGIESALSGIRVAEAFTNEEYEIDKFEEGNARFREAKKDFYKHMGIFHCGMDFLINIMDVVVIGFGGYLVMTNSLRLDEIVVFLLYTAAFRSPIRRLASFVEQFESGIAGFDRFLEVMAVEPDIVDAPGARPVCGVRGDIEYKNVSFSYDKGVNVLNGLSLAVPAGSKVAIVGPSGGGKSTLCQLLPRFYEIDGGEITLDGKNIKDITLSSLRKNVGIVQQDVFMFAGTIGENIRYGRVDATQEEVVSAAKRSEIHDFIMSLERGYDTEVGERGVMLSGGQKQRISIARIFLKNPPVLILDEATSALDMETELKIAKALDELAKGRTTLVIAHRLSTIRNAHKIVYVDYEGVRETGSHDELMERGALYKKMYQTQFPQEG